jgi:hypothetical protein
LICMVLPFSRRMAVKWNMLILSNRLKLVPLQVLHV